jgi:hypothetical protein
VAVAKGPAGRATRHVAAGGGAAAGRAAAVDRLPTDRTRTWLGPPYWANRLQDWRLSRGRLECVTTSRPMRTRTVAVLTQELVAGDRPARIGVRTGLLAEGEGFSGFLIGAGSGALDHRATALVQGASGEGGGILCVYYGAFRYGVSFALVEDRKFKNGDKDNRDPTGRRYDLTILGDRQERFLGEWAAADPGSPKLCFSQTLWGCLQTDERGRAQFDADADAAVAGRRAALELVKRAGALLLSGDQHLASLVRHGLDGFDDGPVQFVAPAAGNAWQRWFEPAGGLPNPGAAPHTGDFTDA